MPLLLKEYLKSFGRSKKWVFDRVYDYGDDRYITIFKDNIAREEIFEEDYEIIQDIFICGDFAHGHYCYMISDNGEAVVLLPLFPHETYFGIWIHSKQIIERQLVAYNELFKIAKKA